MISYMHSEMRAELRSLRSLRSQCVCCENPSKYNTAPHVNDLTNAFENAKVSFAHNMLAVTNPSKYNTAPDVNDLIHAFRNAG